MNATGRGVLIFVAALVTIWLWAPLSNRASRNADGVIITETFFGPLRYLTLHTELKEPDYTMQHTLYKTRLAITTALSAALWTVVILKVKGKPLTPAGLNGNETGPN